MDSDEDAPPPPPPSSLPPGGEEERKPKSGSEKFKALQGMLSSAPTMYSPPKDLAGEDPAPPPSKRVHAVQENDGGSSPEDASRLKHTTKERPRRKVRPPSRKSSSGGSHEPRQQLHEEAEEATLMEEEPPDLPPPPPPLSDLPAETSDHELEEENTPTESPSHPINKSPAFSNFSEDEQSPTASIDIQPLPQGLVGGSDELNQLHEKVDEAVVTGEVHPDISPPPPPLSDLPVEMSGHELKEENTPTESPPQPVNKSPALSEAEQNPIASSNEYKIQPLSDGLPVSGASGVEEQKQGPITPPLSSASSKSPTVASSPQSKGIVMGSFSERLKRIRENRSANKSPLLRGSPSPKIDSPLLRGSPSPKTTSPLTVNIAERLSSTKQTSGSDLLVSASPLTSFPTSPALSTQSTSSSLSYGGLTPPISTTALPVNNLESFTEALKSKKIGNFQMDTRSDLEAQPVAVVASSVIITDASESLKLDTRYEDARKLLHTEISPSGEATVTTEGTEPSEGTQQSTDPLSFEHTPPQLKKKPLVLDIPVEEDDDEAPTVPPPPIPDLPPPPDDLPFEMDSEEPADSSTQSDPAAVIEKVAKPASVTTKSSFRTIRKKEEWTRKSAELDSLMLDPLPLLISTKTSSNRLPDPLPEVNESPLQVRNEYPQQTDGETELLTNDNVLHGSSESLPSLPETPPPELPDAPPPDLPSSFSLNGIEFESDALEERVISETLLIPSEDSVQEGGEVTALPLPTRDANAQDTEIASELPECKAESQPISSPESSPPLRNEQPPATHSDKVLLCKKRKKAANETSLQDMNLQRSAFDALISVEPTAEEKREPQLSAEQRRSLALEASRRSDADMSPLLEQWKISVPSTQPDGMEKNEIVSRDCDEIKESIKKVESPGSNEIMVDVNSSPTEGTKSRKDLLSIREQNTVRPRSIAGMDDLQPSLKHLGDDESRLSLPPDSEIFQSINIIPDSAPKLTDETKAKWKKSHLLTADHGNLSLSASTGQLFSKGRVTNQEDDGAKAGKSSSWRTLHSSSESLPHFVGLPKKSPISQMQPFVVSPLAANISVASNSSKDESISQTNKEKDVEIHQESLQQISYAQKLQVQSRASARKRRSLVLSEDDQTPTSLESAQEDSLLAKVPLRKKVKNLQLASVMAERPLDSPRPASLVLDRDILKTDPSNWSVDEVCRWLELIGLGAFRQVFRERGVNGALLLQIDVQLFDELGVDSHEIREVFLAKIYELSNPRFSMGGIEDDFRLAVDDYTSEDWKKFQAAVNVLKSPILGDSVELEPSAIGEYLHTEYIRSHSTPNISKITELPDDRDMAPGRSYTTPGTYFVFPSPIGDNDHSTPYASNFPGSVPLAIAHRRWRRKSEPSNTPILDTRMDLNHSTSGDDRLAEWVADLPENNGYGRARALTAPSRGTAIKEANKPSDSENGVQLSKTLPRDLNLEVEVSPNRVASPGGSSRDGSTVSPTQKSPAKQTPKKEKRRSRQQSSSPRGSESSSLGPPGLIRLHMDTIQKGTHYKSFMADNSTTAEQLVMLALDKININSQDHANFCIVEKIIGENGQPQRKALKPSQPILSVQSHWPQEDSCCLELRRRRLPQQNKVGTSPPATAPNQSDASKPGPDDGQVLSLQSQLDTLNLQLASKEALEEELKALREENADLTSKLQTVKENHQVTSSELQEKLDSLNLEKQRLEDQVLVLKAAAVSPSDEAPGDSEGPTKLLEQVQARYEIQMNSLTSELREKERMEQEMNIKLSDMEGKMSELAEKSDELNMKTRLLGERNQQIHSLEKDLAIKEETIQKLRVQLEEADLSADQMLAYQKTLQAMEVTSKQQQEFANRTIRDLREQLSRLTIESSQQEQLAQMVRSERDRLARDQQAKDALIASLEADLTSYQTLSDTSTTESSRVQALQRSLSVHEVAIASLRGEFQRQSGELKLAGEEVSRLRKSLAKKEQQLFLLSEEPSRSSFFDVLCHLPPHTLVTSEIAPAPQEDSEGSETSGGRVGNGDDSTIKVMSAPGAGAIDGSVVISVPKQLQGCGIQPRDWMLEINGTNVASKSYRETNKLLLHHHHQGTTVKLVVARPLDSSSLTPNHNAGVLDKGTPVLASIEDYQKLNTSLNAKLEFQSAEVDHWKQECERLKDEILRYSIAQQDKDSELKYLQTALQELKYQLEDSERARSQLEEIDRSASHLNVAQLEANLKKRGEELKRIKAAEKARVVELKKLQQEKDKAVQVLRQHMVASEDLHDVLGDSTRQEDEGSLNKASRSELVKRLRNVEGDFSRHKAYLDQLLTIIIDQHPELLSMLGEVQRLRDKMEADADSWC